MPSPTATADNPERSRWGLFRTILTFAAIAWIVRSLIFAPFYISSGSMLPTLMIGEYVLVAKWPYGYSRYSFPFELPPLNSRVPAGMPERGDIVVFRSPADARVDVIKRVIGLPGDTVEVRGGRTLLNGQPLDRQPLQPFALPISPNTECRTAPGAIAPPPGQCLFPAFRETLPGGRSYTILDQINDGPGDDLAAVRVPAGHVFLMGDNRDDSLDSRFLAVEGGVGAVPLRNIVGRATAIFWSTDGSSSYWLPWTWFTAQRDGRIGTGLQP